VTDSRTGFLTRAVDWLRAGYPAGVPRQDYVALLGLLRRKLTDVEVHQIAQDLAERSVATSDPISTTDIQQMINDSVLQQASAEDVARVSARLAAGGWPLVDPPND
jgi:type II secretory pathway component PulM